MVISFNLKIGGGFRLDSGLFKRGDKIKAMAVFGTRPEAIKLAPLLAALSRSKYFRLKSVATGQHRQMLDRVLSSFGIIPDYDLRIMSNRQSLTEIAYRVLEGLTDIIKKESPNVIIVQGDTTTTFAGSLAAFYSGVRIAHIEAGLRTGDKRRPFPEEANRVLTSHLADWHFAPTLEAKNNLIKENIAPDSIFITGNTVIDALFQSLKKTSLSKFAGVNRMILVTAHRRENWGKPLKLIVAALKRILDHNPEIEMVIPVHANPLVRQVFERELKMEPRAKLINPLDYHEMVAALSVSYLIITDSGGIQEEAASLGKPVLLLRETTERPEAVKAGTVKLVGTDPERILAATNILLRDPVSYRKMARAVNYYGDGKATARIVTGLLYGLGLIKSRPVDFIPVG
jgi:UDP-N-acetylglucosamine 2-epimerase (non-hydrolysing)